LHDKDLDIFGPTIHTWWNAQNKYLKNNLMNHMVGLFGDMFNKSEITSRDDTYLKYVRDQYRVQLKKNPKYDRPLAIPEREWKNIQDNTKESALRQEGKTPPGPAR
jgi:hypothetical protein